LQASLTSRLAGRIARSISYRHRCQYQSDVLVCGRACDWLQVKAESPAKQASPANTSQVRKTDTNVTTWAACRSWEWPMGRSGKLQIARGFRQQSVQGVFNCLFTYYQRFPVTQPSSYHTKTTKPSSLDDGHRQDEGVDVLRGKFTQGTSLLGILTNDHQCRTWNKGLYQKCQNSDCHDPLARPGWASNLHHRCGRCILEEVSNVYEGKRVWPYGSSKPF
jgi:hypothetical protein